MSTSAQNNLEGQRALVTGATSGIGRAVALQLSRDGAEVVVHGRNEARGATTVREIEAADGTASFVAADLADATDVKWLAGEVGDVGMAARGHGSIVSLSSMAGGVGLVGGAAYGATKASLEAMTRAWAAEYSADGVRVNAIAPGPVYTPTPSGPDFIAALGETTPMHRASQPEEIAEVIAFLASSRASYITGATIAADGGRRAI
jgi:NAD(P)-dependent dehydrogenase (short-subunit alcohol dehydrogenase family)